MTLVHRIFKISSIVVVVTTIAALGYAIWFLFLFVGYEDVEIERFSSPDGAVEAVRVERRANATLDDPTLVYVVPRRAKATGEPIFLGDHVEGLTLKWLDDRTLLVHADMARIFRNQEAISLTGSSARTVSIKFAVTNSQ